MDSLWDPEKRTFFVSDFSVQQKWDSDVAPMPGARMAFSVVKVDEFRFLIVGGRNVQNGTLHYPTTVYMYDTRSDTWSSLPEISIGRVRCGACRCNGKVYVFGGLHYNREMDLFQNLVTIDYMDLAAPTLVWKTLDQKVRPLSYDGAVAVKDRFVYLICGQEREVFIFDTETGEVRTGPQLTCERSGCGVALVDHQIYVVGGGSTDGAVRDTVESLTIDMNTGVPIGHWTLCPSPMSERRYCSAVTTVGYYLVVIGGNFTTLTEVLDTRKLVWRKLPSTTEERIDAAAVTLDISQVFVLGGYAGDSMEKLHFQPTTLTQLCELSLTRHLSAENIKSALLSANQVKAPTLLHACLDFIRENFRTVFADPEFFALCTEEPELWRKLLNVQAAPFDEHSTSRKRARDGD